MPIWKRFKLFRTIISVNQLSLYGAVAEMCDLQMQWLVVSELFQETKKHLNRKDGSEGLPKFGPYWKLRLVAWKVNTELRKALCLEAKTISLVGQNF